MNEHHDTRSPLYEAHHALRYERQQLIRCYQKEHSCRLVVMADAIFPHSVVPFEETIFDANPDQDLHVMLYTLGGDGETALRLVRQAQSRCKELVVIIPDQAKSAGTLFVLGADKILMGPTSDLGPVDPQFQLPNGSLVACKSIIAAVEDAEKKIQAIPDTYTLHASLLGDITALMVQQARDALARTEDQVKVALSCASSRSEEKIEKLAQSLNGPLIKTPQSHGTVVSAKDAKDLGLPVTELSGDSNQWRSIWRMWTKYIALNPNRIFEGQTASHIF